ncbi:MAG: sulfatase-like hydrolase/transferase [Bacillota bacterium]|nr:sulfatase-like hydrolase/transferase [Bacillota bacterium]
MTIPILNRFINKYDDKQQDILTLIFAYAAVTVLHICIMFLFGWYSVHFAYVIAPVLLILLFSVPLGLGDFFHRHPSLQRLTLIFFNTLVAYFYTETITKYLAPNRIFCWQFLFNIILTYLLYYVFIAITGRFKISLIIVNFLLAAICVTNEALLDLRGRPLFISDFSSMETALNVSGSYHLSLIKLIVIFLIFVFLTAFTILLVQKSEANIEKAGLANRIIAVICIGGMLFVSYGTDLYKNLNIKLTYWSHQNGILLDWIIESRDFRVKVPENYSVKNIEAVRETYTPSDNIKYNGVKPNIIAIMNESFSDLSVVSSFNTDIDYMPFLHAAMAGKYADMTVGNAYTSVYGGNTANSEYEFLTNDSMVLYPQNSVPYQTFLDGKGEISSLVSQVKSLGYSTTSMHPYWASGWNRTNIYSYMGFENQHYLDDMSNIDYIRGYCSDSCDYQKIIELFENRDKNKPFFLFNVTIQNHGGYTNSSYPSTVHLTDYPGQFPQTEQYLSLIRESDKALLGLIEYFRSVKEPTVIIFFGDHQPSVETGFYEKLYGKPFSSLSDEESQRMYMTKYMVWKNFKTAYTNIGDTSVNYLSALVLRMIGMPMTTYQKYLLDMHGNYPIVTAAGVRDKNGNYIPVGKADLSFYKTIVYNHMIDNEKYKRQFFENTYKVNNDYLAENYNVKK